MLTILMISGKMATIGLQKESCSPPSWLGLKIKKKNYYHNFNL